MKKTEEEIYKEYEDWIHYILTHTNEVNNNLKRMSLTLELCLISLIMFLLIVIFILCFFVH